MPSHTNPVSDEVIATEVEMNGSVVKTAILEVAVLLVVQAALLVSTQVTASPLFKLLVENCRLLVPWFCPFTCHCSTGCDPPPVISAEKTMVLPWQVSGDAGVIVIAGVIAATTVNVWITCDVPSFAAIIEVPAPVIWIFPDTIVATAGLLLLYVIGAALVAPGSKSALQTVFGDNGGKTIVWSSTICIVTGYELLPPLL